MVALGGDYEVLTRSRRAAAVPILVVRSSVYPALRTPAVAPADASRASQRNISLRLIFTRSALSLLVVDVVMR